MSLSLCRKLTQFPVGMEFRVHLGMYLMITDERLGGETVAYGEMHLCMGNTATRMREKAWDQGEVGCRLRQLKLFTYMSLNLILCNGCNAEHLLRGNAIADSCSSFENENHERRCLCLHACLYALTA